MSTVPAFSGVAGVGVEAIEIAQPLDATVIPAQTIRTASEELIDILDARPSSSGVSVNRRTVLGYPAVFRGINLISNVAAKLPLFVRRIDAAGGSTVDRDHPAYALLKRNRRKNSAGQWEPGRMPASTLRKTVTAHALLHGNGYAAIMRNNRGEPTELLILDPEITFPVKVLPGSQIDDDTADVDAANAQIWYVTEIDGVPLKLPSEDVIHIRNLSIDGLIGLSVIDLMKEAFGLGIAAQRFGARFFGEGSNASGILMIPGHIKKEAQENVIKMWNSMAQGISKSHRVALIQDGVKYQQLTIPPEQAQFLQTRRFELIEVANILGLPPHKLGDDSKTAYNSLEAENKSALDESYDPWLCAWEDECESKLLTEDEINDETHLIKFDRSTLLQTQLKERADAYRLFREIGVYSVNDCLRREGEPTVGPEGDIRHVPANWVAIGSEATPTDDPAVLAKLRPLVVDRLAHMAEIEIKTVRQAIKKRSDVAAWSEEWYQQFSEKLIQALRPAVRAIWSLLEWDNANDAVIEAVAQWSHDSRSELAAALAEPDSDSALESFFARYPVRIEQFLATLTEDVQCRRKSA